MSDGDRPLKPGLQVTLKFATSLDARIATASGESKWITGEAARAQGHQLRAAHDAILVGSGTVLTDDPELTARLDAPVEKQPVRIVADSRGRTPASAKLFATMDKGPIVVATGETIDLDERRWPSDVGGEYWMLPVDPESGHISVVELLATAVEAGIKSILVEGGGELAASLMGEGLVDRIEWFRAPIVLGGDGRPCLAAFGLENLAEAPQFERVGLRELGLDVWESYERAERRA